MARFPQQPSVVSPQPGAYLAPAVAAFCILVGCVNLTPPWEKPDAKGATGAAGSTATTSVIGGTSTVGGTTEAGSGGVGGSRDSSTGGSTDSIDASVGGGGASDPGQSSAGSTGQDAAVDAPSSGTGGSDGRMDAGGDVPQSSVGGKADAGPDGLGSAGGTAGTGGSAIGGTSTTGGSTVAGSGGGSATGGTGNTGGTGGASSTVPDAGSDANPLLNGLVVYYRFESASGTTVQDSSGNGYDGTLSSGPAPDGGTAPTGDAYTFVTGKVGNAVALHKAGLGYVRVPPAVFANRTELTIAFWVRVTTEQSWQRILDVGVTPNPYQYRNSSTGTTYFNIVPKNASTNMLFSITTDGYSNEQTLSTTSVATNTWTHVTVVLDAGGGGKLYINGTETVSNTSLALRPKDLGTIDYAFIGKSRFDVDPPFDGVVDCFRVYSRALSPAEVTALFSYTVGS